MNDDDIVELMRSMYKEGLSDGESGILYVESAMDAVCRVKIGEVANVIHKKYNINPHARSANGKT